MYDIFLYSGILGKWEHLQATHTLAVAIEIAARYTRGAYANDPAWVQIRHDNAVVWES